VGEIVEPAVGHAFGRMIVISVCQNLENAVLGKCEGLANLYAIFTCVEFLQ
jgi:hypothetical protein